MVNYTVLVANRGWFYQPHIVRAIGNEKNETDFKKNKNVVSINPEYIDVIKEGMAQVVTMGTARGGQLDSIPIAGKTGTADNPHGDPHAVFVGFAPIDNPKIAICVIVENACFGSTYAVPIASLMIEKYINRTVKRKDVEERMIGLNLLNK